jgi:hypothetical protein
MLRLRLRSRERERYYVEAQVWAAVAPHQKEPGKPPEVPEILKT